MFTRQHRYVINTRFRLRPQRGSILFVASASALVVVLLGMILFSRYQYYILARQKAEYAVKASALQAALDLSKVIVADPRWGYLSLSDHPASGSATLAPDNEPLPINSINTIISTVRTEKLLAQQIQSDALKDLAEQDYQSCKKSEDNLQSILNQSIAPSRSLKINDMTGKPINVYCSAYEKFSQNLPELNSARLNIKEFSLSLGWLADGSTTVTTDTESKMGKIVNNTGRYPSFINQPVGKDSFYFAGVSEEARLVEAARFRPADKTHFSSCIAVNAVLELVTPGGLSFLGTDKQDIQQFTVSAVAIPYGQHNYCAPGTLVVFLPQGSSHRVSCLADILTKTEMNQIPGSHAIAHGDYPSDARSTLATDAHQKSPISYAVARALFDWLRTCNARARNDSILNALNTPFEDNSDTAQTNLAVAYSINSTGQVQTKLLTNAGFMTETVADGQCKDEATNILSDYKGALCLSVRDEVTNPDCHSKHGAQPLPTELPCSYSQFLSEKEQMELATQTQGPIRESYRKGGLAAAVEIYFVPEGGN